MILRDALLHFAHFVCIFLLASLLVGELLLFRKALTRDALRQLSLVDRWYGITAGLVIATGVSLLLFGAKGPGFYTHNPVFWTKMALFAAVALLSIVPTLAFLRWSRQTSGSVTIADAEYARIRAFLWVEAVIFVFIPLCATLMANGI
jgi:putative membrane protein